MSCNSHVTAANFHQYMAADGLSDNNVLCGLRDKYGFVWLGTNNGLNCFDGTQNTIFRNMVGVDNPLPTSSTSQLLNNTITALYEHGDDIWFGGAYGLYIYHRDTKRFSRFNKKTQYGVSISATVHNIVSSQNGLIWIGTQGQGLFIYDPATDILTQDSRHGAFICDIMAKDDSPMFVATLNGTVVLYSQKGDFMLQHDILNYQTDKKNVCVELVGYRLFIGTEHGLYTILRGNDIVTPVPGVNMPIHSLLSSGSELLLGTDKGIVRYNTVEQRLVTPQLPISSPPHLRTSVSPALNCPINQMMWDQDSTLWVMTKMAGVFYRPSRPSDVQTTFLPGDNGLTIRALCEMPDGSIWIGADSGLYSYDPRIQHVTAHTDVKEGVNTLLLDGDNLWIGTQQHGIIVLQLSNQLRRLKNYQYSAERTYTLPSNEVTCMIRSSQGDIYVGTSWGLCRFERDTETFRWYFDIGSMTRVTSLTEDKRGCIWAATTNHGLFRQTDPRQDFHSYTSNNLPQTLSLSTVFADHKGIIWGAINGGGLCCITPDDHTFQLFGASIPALQEQQIYFIVEDPANNLWLGLENGIMKIDAQRLGESVQMMYVWDDVTRMQKPYNAALINTSGILFAGHYDELDKLPTSSSPHLLTSSSPRLYITHIIPLSLNDPSATLQRLPQSEEVGGSLPAAMMWPFADGAVRLPFSDNNFTLHFSAPSFVGTDSQQSRFEYMLEGIDKTWLRGTKTPEATYANVPPGNYTFLLRTPGDNNADNYARLRITILPPWYRTTLAYVIYALLLVAAIVYMQRRYTKKLRQRYNRRLKAYQDEQEKDNFQSKIRFFINLVHEIRTPLTLMNLPLEAISDISNSLRVDEPLVPDASPSGMNQPCQTVASETGTAEANYSLSTLNASLNKHISAIRRNMNYLLGITNQLLDFQKAESGHIQVNLTNCDVRQLLTDVYLQFEDAIHVQGKEIQLQLPDDDVFSAIDVDKVQKVMMNLVANASKYARSEIIVRLTVEGKQLRIAVIDDGPGVPPEERDKIFDVYYQIGHDSIAATLGTGLGLAYAKMLAQAHNGDLLLSDSIGGGSNFELRLPIQVKESGVRKEELGVKPPVPDASPSEMRQRPGEQNYSLSTINSSLNHRILLVEDNEELLQMTSDALRRHFHVVKARDGQEALDLLHYNDVDVIVSDVMMPRIDGIELCRRLKSDLNYSHIPIILLTAKTTIEAKLEGMESGANIYLEKPFTAKQLILQITSLLQMRQQFYQRMRNIDGFQAVTDDAATGDTGLTQQDLHFVERLQEMVLQNMSDEEFSIDQLAERMNMSRSSFYRKIKALTGVTPIEYLKTSRLDRAAQLLRQGIRINEVAARVGFTSSSYFAKCFKAQFGCLPKDYQTPAQQ